MADAGGSGRLAWINLKPYVDFTLAPTRGFPGLSVAFTNGTRSADGTTWSWSFGDGATSTAASPTHAYPAKGIYSVTLTAQGLDPADTVTKTLRDAVCVGYVFSSAPETATTAPFTRDYARTGRLDDADRTAQALLVAVPNLAPALLAQGGVALQRGKVKEAEAAFRKASEADPKSPLAFYQLGRVQLLTQRRAEAIASLKKAQQLDPDRLALFG